MLGSTLDLAKQLITGDRNKAYGDPREDFKRTVNIYNLTRGKRMETPADAAWFMMCVKMSRECNAHGPDNLTDLCGYADIYNYLTREVVPSAYAPNKNICTPSELMEQMEQAAKAMKDAEQLYGR